MATEQALRHVRDNLNFLGSFMKSDRAQIVLLITMQEHAFVNQIFLKIFSRFCLMMFVFPMASHLKPFYSFLKLVKPHTLIF